MQSQLTRRVFRSLINGQQIHHRGCLRPRKPSRDCRGTGLWQLHLVRHFDLATLFKPEATRAGPTTPGFDIMSDLSKSMLQSTRAPDNASLKKAVMVFFQNKFASGTRISEQEVGKALDTITHLRNTGRSGLGLADLTNALWVLSRSRSGTTQRRELVQLLSSEIGPLLENGSDDAYPEAVEAAVAALCAVQSADGAGVLLVDQLRRNPALQGAHKYVETILEEYRSRRYPQFENRIKDLLSSMGIKTSELSGSLLLKLIETYAKNDRPEEAIQWLEALDHSLQASAISAFLNSCARSCKEKLGRQILENYLHKHTDSKLVWQSVFRFSTGTGHGVDEVARMIDVMERRKPASANWTFDSDMLNDLVLFANDRKDPYLAERLIMLGERRGLQADIDTYKLQMVYRSEQGDLGGAMVAYRQMKRLHEQGMVSNSVNSQVIAINYFVQKLCEAYPRFMAEDVTQIAEDLSDVRNHDQLEGLTIAGLCAVHLKRQENQQITNLLQTHFVSLPTEERSMVRQALVKFCLDKRNDPKTVWQAYTILRGLFAAALPREDRERLMFELFSRRHARTAFKILQHMHTDNAIGARPVQETYIQALLSASRLKNRQIVEQITNLLKVDQNTDLNTKLRNALILAWTNVGEPGFALNFWDDIINSVEGPSYSSIIIALRTCEDMLDGFERGQAIWQRLEELDVEITRDLFTAWACFLASWQKDNEPHRAWLQRAPEYGVNVDAELLGSVFHAINTNVYQAGTLEDIAERHPDSAQVAAEAGLVPWMANDYPQQVAELRKRGLKLRKDNSYTFRGIERRFEP